jgi:hypothetical protein
MAMISLAAGVGRISPNGAGAAAVTVEEWPAQGGKPWSGSGGSQVKRPPTRAYRVRSLPGEYARSAADHTRQETVRAMKMRAADVPVQSKVMFRGGFDECRVDGVLVQ